MFRTRSFAPGLCAALLVLLRPCHAEDASSHPLLWRVEGGGKVAHVFGTIHLAGPAETKLAPAVAAAVEKCDALYCEIPMDPGSQMKAATSLLSGGKPLSEVLPKELYSRAEAELKRINPALDLKPFERMHVWALSVALTMLEEQLKNPGAQPLDAQLYARAQAAGKQVGGIETVDEQLGVFGGFSEAEQVEMLRSTLDDMEKARREGKSLVGDLRAAYLSGDLKRLEAEIQDQMGSLQGDLKTRVLKALLIDRNHRMAERIASKMKESPNQASFFAVGAGHLGGEEGVLALLEKGGLKVSRVE